MFAFDKYLSCDDLEYIDLSFFSSVLSCQFLMDRYVTCSGQCK